MNGASCCRPARKLASSVSSSASVSGLGLPVQLLLEDAHLEQAGQRHAWPGTGIEDERPQIGRVPEPFTCAVALRPEGLGAGREAIAPVAVVLEQGCACEHPGREARIGVATGKQLEEVAVGRADDLPYGSAIRIARMVGGSMSKERGEAIEDRARVVGAEARGRDLVANTQQRANRTCSGGELAIDIEDRQKLAGVQVAAARCEAAFELAGRHPRGGGALGAVRGRAETAVDADGAARGCRRRLTSSSSCACGGLAHARSLSPRRPRS